MPITGQSASLSAPRTSARGRRLAVASAAGGKSAPSCPPADDQAAAIVDSQMTVEQAVRLGWSGAQIKGYLAQVGPRGATERLIRGVDCRGRLLSHAR